MSQVSRRPQMEATVQFTRSGSTSKQQQQPIIEVEAPLEIAGRSRSASRSFKRFKSPFSKSAPSSPERPTAPLPEFPAQLSDKVAALKMSDATHTAPAQAAKPSKKQKAKAEKQDRIHYHADSGNQRPMAYATNVQLEMLMGGGSEDYWLSKSRKTSPNGEEETVGTGVEVGGFKDEDGNIWWDVEEKAEWTSLLPKDGQGLPATTNDMWVDFNTDYRRTSTSSADSTISTLSAELMEEMDGPVLYGDVEAEHAHSIYGMQKSTGTMLFPIAMGDEMTSEAAAARAIMSQASRTLSSKSAVVIVDGFEDHFLSYEASTPSTVRAVNVAPAVTKQIRVVPVAPSSAKATKKGSLLKSLWGNKQSSRQ